MPSVAPVVGEIVRLSATEIRIVWSGLPRGNSSSGSAPGPVEVDVYFIRYRPLSPTQTGVQKRNADDLAVVVETNQTEFQVTGLEPGLAYAVSVAAGNRAGVGTYSDEITVGCE